MYEKCSLKKCDWHRWKHPMVRKSEPNLQQINDQREEWVTAENNCNTGHTRLNHAKGEPSPQTLQRRWRWSVAWQMMELMGGAKHLGQMRWCTPVRQQHSVNRTGEVTAKGGGGTGRLCRQHHLNAQWECALDLTPEKDKHHSSPGGTYKLFSHRNVLDSDTAKLEPCAVRFAFPVSFEATLQGWERPPDGKSQCPVTAMLCVELLRWGEKLAKLWHHVIIHV